MSSRHDALIASLALWLCLALLPATASSDPLLLEDFDSGYASWTASGNSASEDLHSVVPDSVRLRLTGTIERAVSTAGYQDVAIGAFLAARLLEGSDQCIFEVSTNGGSSFTPLLVLTNGEDDGEFRWNEFRSASYDDNPNLVLRFRNASNALADHCYAEDTSVSGFPLGSMSCDAAPPFDPYSGYVEDYDPLSGSGSNARNDLTAGVLNSGPAPGAPVDSAAFALPADAAAPLHEFEGALALSDEATSGSFLELRDDFSYTGNGDDPRKHLPDFDYEFVQTGSHLVPVARGIAAPTPPAAAHPYWEFVIEPGRVWSETGDAGLTRAALPFSLMQRNSNCLHNGLMTFLFDASQISKVAYQITSETCAYFQFDMWGLLDATYAPSAITDALALKSNHQRHRAGRMATKPIDDLAVDHPGVDPAEFTHPSEVAAADLTLYGVVFEGVHYTGGCGTRTGPHPFCDVLRVPSYSTAKTSFAASASLRLERLYPGYLDETVASWVPEAAADPEGDFDDVTIEHALDMATGNYRLAGYIDDESSISTNDFFLPETHAEKVDYAVSRYPRKATPGTSMHYHTTDTYLVASAGQRYLRQQTDWCADLFDDRVVEDLWRPLGFDPGTLTSRRTYDPVAQPFGGFGLSYLPDDVAKLGQFLGVDHGRIAGVQQLDPEGLAAGKFAVASDLGLPWSGLGNYNLSFWGRDKSSETGCTTMVPYLSGYGGISIVLTAGGVVYYYFSDGGSFSWERAFSEAESLRASCNVSVPNPPDALSAVAVDSQQVELRWTSASAPVGVLSYRLYRDGGLIAVTTGNDWVDIGLPAGETREYFVEALDAAGNVSASGSGLLVGDPVAVPSFGAPAAGLLIAALALIAGRRMRRTRTTH